MTWCVDICKDASELTEDLLHCTFEQTGQAVHGYSYSDHDDCLDLYLTIYRRAGDEYTVLKSEADAALKRLKNFFVKCHEKNNKINLEDPAFDLNDTIQKANSTLVRFFLFTDGKSTLNRLEDEEIGGITCQTHIWDINRFYRFFFFKRFYSGYRCY